MEDWNGKTIFTDIISLYSITVMYLARKAIEFGEITQNKSYYAVQGHYRSSRSVPIETRMRLPISNYSNSQSYRCGVIPAYCSNFGHCIFRLPLGGLRTMYGVHLGLIGKRVVNFLLVIIELFSLDVTACLLYTSDAADDREV